MRARLTAVLIGLVLAAGVPVARAQDVGALFRDIQPWARDISALASRASKIRRC